MSRKSNWMMAVHERKCDVCIRHGSMDCPNSIKCHATVDKPFFEPKPMPLGPVGELVEILKGGTR